MMTPVILTSMIFSLIVILMIGGFILAFPLTRRLGQLLEHRLRDKEGTGASAEQIAALRVGIDALETRVQALADRQAFMDSLLDQREASPQVAAASSVSRSTQRPDSGQRERSPTAAGYPESAT